MLFSLVQMSARQMREVAEARVPEELALRVEEGALPPPFICALSLEQVAAGSNQSWCNTFLIVRGDDNRIVGSCGFKSEPRNGRVEIGYGVAPSGRGGGAATAAVSALLKHAFSSGAQEVVAEVEPGNAPSNRVVEKTGFRKIGARVNQSNEYVVQWLACEA